VDRFPGGDGEDDAGVLHLKPSQAPAVGDSPEDGLVGVRDGQGTRFAAAHTSASDVDGRL